MNKRILSIAMFATLALAACGSANESSGTAKVKNGVGRGSSISAQPGSGTPRTKNAALSAPETTTSPGAKRQEILGSYDPKNFTFTFTRPVDLLQLTWVTDTGEPVFAPKERRNVTTLNMLDVNYWSAGPANRAKMNLYYADGAKFVGVFVPLRHDPLGYKSDCGFDQDKNDITACSPVSTVVYQYFDDFKALGDPVTLNIPATTPTIAFNFAKLDPPAGTSRVKASFRFVKGGGTEDIYFPVYLKPDLIATPRKDSIHPRLTK